MTTLNTTADRRLPLAETGSAVGAFLGGLIGIALTALVVWLLVQSGAPTWLLGSAEKGSWYVVRASGTVAYLLLSGATVWGLALSSKIIKERVPAPLTMSLHRSLSWLAIVYTLIHAGALLFDHYYSYRLTDLLIPFIGPYRAGWVGLGVIGLYGLILLSVSFSLKKRIGHRTWRMLHHLSFPLYLLITLHGLMAGSDSGQAGMRGLFVGSALLVCFLTIYRVLTMRSKQRGARLSAG
ncbi:MAG: ferric reductase-like transmembrane domain-containing protein [Anaerolineales bacterium]|nr:ferric reductase-like transmembrane domain-containing protein [Anaerolineales bacterium]MCB9128330.1 ferric reductase-like transmembrane domain-containing protein [Ardenticatenales bacterium]MCB9172142.1 ferric reductase-like transmembrane domain-containing protein [Ardenticatenales bacterium]